MGWLVREREIANALQPFSECKKASYFLCTTDARSRPQPQLKRGEGNYEKR